MGRLTIRRLFALTTAVAIFMAIFRKVFLSFEWSWADFGMGLEPVTWLLGFNEPLFGPVDYNDLTLGSMVSCMVGLGLSFFTFILISFYSAKLIKWMWGPDENPRVPNRG